MRTIVTLLFALFATPAFAQGWTIYDNARFGYSIAIPPGFEGLGESEGSDGQYFIMDGKPTDLLVWADFLVSDFEQEIALRQGWDADEGWTVTEQTTTPRWANYQAIKGSRQLYQRMMLLCGEPRYAAFRMEFSVADASALQPLIEHMETRFNAGC